MPRSFLIRSKAQFRNARRHEITTSDDSVACSKCPTPEGEITVDHKQRTFTTLTSYAPAVKQHLIESGSTPKLKLATAGVSDALQNSVTEFYDITKRLKPERNDDVTFGLKSHNGIGFSIHSRTPENRAVEPFTPNYRDTPTKPSTNVTPCKNRTIWSPISDLERLVEVKANQKTSQAGPAGSWESLKSVSSAVTPFTPLSSLRLQQPLGVRVHAHAPGYHHDDFFRPFHFANHIGHFQLHPPPHHPPPAQIYPSLYPQADPLQANSTPFLHKKFHHRQSMTAANDGLHRAGDFAAVLLQHLPFEGRRKSSEGGYRRPTSSLPSSGARSPPDDSSSAGGEFSPPDNVGVRGSLGGGREDCDRGCNESGGSGSPARALFSPQPHASSSSNHSSSSTTTKRSNSFQDGITVGYTYDAFFISDGRARRRPNPAEGGAPPAPAPSAALPAADPCRIPQQQQRYKCSECGKHYATSSNLSRHKQTHRSLESQQAKQCPHCRKVYVSMPALSMHILTHDLKYRCTVCSKAFSRPWLLQGHLRSHSGEKPYGCTHCGRAFADRSNLRAHMQTHSTCKLHACARCGKSFALKAYLNKHLESACFNDRDGEEDSCASSMASIWSV